LVRDLARLQPRGDSEPLTFDPVNWWAGTLILAIALDLARAHAPRIVRSRD
jgi:hypothetical protein